MRRLPILLAIAALAACERKPSPVVPDTDAERVEARAVAAADAYGVAGDRISDVAFWSHPSVAFASLLVAASADRIVAYRIETGESAFEIPDGADALAVFYAGEGPSAVGFALTSRDDAYALYAIRQDGGGAKPVTLGNGGAATGAFCLRSGPVPALYEFDGGALTERTLTIVANAAEASPARAVAQIDEGIACAVDPVTDEVLAVSADGAVRRVNPASGTVFGLAMPAGLAPAGAGLAVGLAESGEAVAQVALLSAATGVVSLFDATDGHALGEVRVKATFELPAVETAQRIEVAAANFGGVYRDGALALVTSGDGAPIRLVPWSGVMGALALPVAGVIDPRLPRGEAPEEDVISIELIEP